MADRYKIVRFFQSDDYESTVIKRGLTLEEAQEHCHNPETSSITGTSRLVKKIEAEFGPWFDGYTKDSE